MIEMLENHILSGGLKMLLKFKPPKSPEVFEGKGSILNLASHLKANGHKNILIVTTQGMIGLGLLDNLTDKLKSYGAAKREILEGLEHRQHKGLNSRAENSHRPTRIRERRMG